MRSLLDYFRAQYGILINAPGYKSNRLGVLVVDRQLDRSPVVRIGQHVGISLEILVGQGLTVHLQNRRTTVNTRLGCRRTGIDTLDNERIGRTRLRLVRGSGESHETVSDVEGFGDTVANSARRDRIGTERAELLNVGVKLPAAITHLFVERIGFHAQQGILQETAVRLIIIQRQRLVLFVPQVVGLQVGIHERVDLLVGGHRGGRRSWIFLVLGAGRRGNNCNQQHHSPQNGIETFHKKG